MFEYFYFCFQFSVLFFEASSYIYIIRIRLLREKGLVFLNVLDMAFGGEWILTPTCF